MNRTKTLRSHTIIPQNLYVERAADSQLKQIVMDMGRPGYILVSRQMGKTNLLLNAKRTLGVSGDKFLYLDVSNTFSDIQNFFRNIIDVALENYPDEFSHLKAAIDQRRSSAVPLPPHKEHELELRDIVRSCNGRFVICLDEIDALTKTQYADQVFSFIRSIYFSGRVNFSEFDRLTYVLSGVAEPTELIRNKDVSPFNIGEKIYLDDFSPTEFNQFIAKAQLPFEQSTIDRIYYWASGNPRVSWDICSTLEDQLIKGDLLTSDRVDQVVREMYLINYDLPPIDHIRTLVEDDSIIRDAIMSIHYNKSETISDAVRSRLYLAGISRPDQGKGKAVSIRNRILLDALSESWIQDVERRKLSIRELADKKYEQAQYADALSLYEEYIAAVATPKERDLVYFKLGNCQFFADKYQEAISSFSKATFKKEQFPSLYFSVLHRIGLCNLILGNHDLAASCFRNILDQDYQVSPLYFYFDSCLNLSSALFHDFEKNCNEILDLNNRVISNQNRVREVADSDVDANRLLYVAYYNLSRASRRAGDLEAALEQLDKSIEIADARAQIGLLSELVNLATTKEKKAELVDNCLQHVLSNNLYITPRNKEYPLDFTLDVCARLVEQVEEFGSPEALDKLFLHLTNKSLAHDANAGNVANQAIYGALSKGNRKTASNLIRKALRLPGEFQQVLNRRHMMTLGMLLTPFSEIGSLGDEYLAEFIEKSDSELIDTDFRVVWGLVQGHLSAKNVEAAANIISRVRALFNQGGYVANDNSTEANFISGKLILDVLEIDLAISRGEDENLKDTIDSLLLQLNRIKTFPLPYFAEDFFAHLKGRVQDLAASLNPATTFKRNARKFGRNEIVKVKFADGTISEGKYKKLQAKIDSGLCALIDESPT